MGLQGRSHRRGGVPPLREVGLSTPISSLRGFRCDPSRRETSLQVTQRWPARGADEALLGAEGRMAVIDLVTDRYHHEEGSGIGGLLLG